ncbi:MAG: GlsB/YeaQ/YmgE family stress response membrane protein [Burkholderiales bacterium]|nr:GlsB/YeaQ/YmgE family stress response membrane protein [Anaerolineae bacterium]
MLAGTIAGRLLRGSGYGLLGDIALGLIGGVVGSILLRFLGVGFVGNIWLVGNIIVGVIGAVVFVYLIRLVHRDDFAR